MNTGSKLEKAQKLRDFNRDILAQHEVYSTGTTGRMLEQELDIEVVKLPLREIHTSIEKKEIKHGMVLLGFFFYWMRQGGVAGTR